MGEGVKNKLRSRSGASIIMALLLFMVCAIVGTVVLTAGTAAAGRASELAKADQRYFSVTSATELLAKKLTGTTYIVTREETKTTTDTTNVLLNGAGEEVSSGSVPGGTTEDTEHSWAITVQNASGTLAEYDKDNLPTNPSLLTEAALRYMLGFIPDTETTEKDIWDTEPGTVATKTWSEFTLTPVTDDSVTTVTDVLPVTVKAELKTTGDLVFTISADDLELILTLNVEVEDDSASPIYKKEITDVTTSTIKKADLPTGLVSAYSAYEYTDVVSTVVTTEETKTKTTTVSWTVHGVNTTVSSPASPSPSAAPADGGE